ncbi:MAG: hypothetical protein HY652_09295 [Acidobacteria bacterium]|nr:hypothetical protein [Acidobacteriota bacterium]
MSVHRFLICVGLLLAGLLLSMSGQTGTSSAQVPLTKGEKYPEPRYPKASRITTVEPLLENAKNIITRSMAYSGNQFPGWEMKAGQKVLFVISRNTDPLVIEAFTRAFEELNCQMDLLVLGPRQSRYAMGDDPASGFDRTLNAAQVKAERERAPLFSDSRWITETAKARGYDRVVGATFRQPEDELDVGYGMDWPTRELLASPSVRYPYEIVEALDRKTWEKLRQADTVHVTDPEGSDIRFTWFPEYWQVIEGTHPTLKNIAGSGSHIYGPGRSEIPLISSHVMGYPQGIVLDKSDAEGVAAGTSGVNTHIKISLKRNEIVNIEGGGRFGDGWRRFVEGTKNIQYPTYPRPGAKFLIECALGTHPKSYPPHNVFESSIARRGQGWIRNRTGIFHIGIGQHLATAWAAARGLPGGHFHVMMWFATYRIKQRNGIEVKTVDKGHLTALDDPQVRQVAARFGNPDELLREDWIPAIPGINSPGDYSRDYAQDPVAWTRAHLRKVYADMLDFRPYP